MLKNQEMDPFKKDPRGVVDWKSKATNARNAGTEELDSIIAPLTYMARIGRLVRSTRKATIKVFSGQEVCSLKNEKGIRLIYIISAIW